MALIRRRRARRLPTCAVMNAEPPSRPQFDLGAGRNGLPRCPTVLLLVDFINPLRFEGAAQLAPAALAAARESADLKRRLAIQRVPAIYANDNYGIWRSEFRDCLSYCIQLGDVAGEMAELLRPDGEDLTILKPRHSGFYATPLELLLTQMHAKSIVLVGLTTDICVQITAADAYLRGYRLWVPSDCAAAESPQRHKTALDYMQRVLHCATHPAASWSPGNPAPLDLGAGT
jgi:nicotinamidase-related amidase